MLTRDPPTQEVRKRTKCLVGQFSDFVSSGSKQARSSYQLDGQDARGQGGWLGGWGGDLAAGLQADAASPGGTCSGRPGLPLGPQLHVLLGLKGRATCGGRCGAIGRWAHCCRLWWAEEGRQWAAPQGIPLSTACVPGPWVRLCDWAAASVSAPGHSTWALAGLTGR